MSSFFKFPKSPERIASIILWSPSSNRKATQRKFGKPGNSNSISRLSFSIAEFNSDELLIRVCPEYVHIKPELTSLK